MILKKIYLEQFAGLSDKSVEFSGGLNIICGPNETGKSTLVKGILALLFMPVAGRGVKYDQFLPVNGGDYISGRLEYSSAGESYLIQKKWRSRGEVMLKAGTTAYSDPQQVENMLRQHLTYNEGTYRNIFVVTQSALSATLDDLRKNSQAIDNIDKVIRGSAFNTHGISVNGLRELILERLKKYNEYWDEELSRPRDNKDIDNPWKRPGLILESFYKKRALEREFEKAVRYECQIDELIKSINALQIKREKYQEFTDKYRQSYEMSRKVGQLTDRKRYIEKEMEEMLEVKQRWPRAEAKKEFCLEQKGDNDVKLQHLEDELFSAKKQEAQKRLKERYEKAAAFMSELERLEAELKSRTKITKKDIDNIVGLQNEVRSYQLQLEAQKLHVKIAGTENITLKAGTTLEELKEYELVKGTELTQSFPGQFIYSDGNVIIEIVSGNADVKTLLLKKKEAESELNGILSDFNVNSIEELKTGEAGYDTIKREAEKVRSSAEAILEGESFESLREKYIAAGTPVPVRDLNALYEEKSKLTAETAKLSERISEIDKYLVSYTQKYGSESALDINILEKREELRLIESELNVEIKYPEGYEDNNRFAEFYALKSSEFEKIKDKLNSQIISKTEAEKNQPEKTSNELKEELTEAEEEFLKTKKEGEAYRKVLNKLLSVVAQHDSSSYRPLKEEIESIMTRLSGGRYKDINMDESISLSLPLGNGLLSSGMLSAGTLDILSLAVRLGTANLLLKDSEGFIIMDDPLINLDSQRREAAVQIIKETASEKRQIILLTCSEENAALFRSEFIKLRN